MNKSSFQNTKTLSKTAVMGGSFNPFHLAHLNSLLTVREKFKIDQILLVPSFKTPLKIQEEELDPRHRVQMLKKAIQDYDFIKLDRQEISRKGLSYTYKTIEELSKKRIHEELFFIMGLDQFYIFDQWKHYQKILQKTNLIVTSRPGFSFPKNFLDLPKGLQPLVKSKKSLGMELSLKPFEIQNPSQKETYSEIQSSSQKETYSEIQSSSQKETYRENQTLSQKSGQNPKPSLLQNTGSNKKSQQNPSQKEKAKQKQSHPFKIYFCSLKDKDISSFYIRSGIQKNQDISPLLPQPVDQYIKKNQLYKKQTSPIDKATSALIHLAVKELKHKKAYEVKTYDLRSKPLPFSFSVMAISDNVRHTKALADHLQKQIKQNLKLTSLNEEGKNTSRWVVLDYGDCIFHIFDDYTGRFYKLEELWEPCLMDEK